MKRIKKPKKIILSHVILILCLVSLSYCAPPIDDYSRIHKQIDQGTTPGEVFATYSADACNQMGGSINAEGTCPEIYDDLGIDDPCNLSGATSQQQQQDILNSPECIEHQGTEKNGGQFWSALLAVTSQQIMGVIADLQNEKIGQQWFKSYAEKKLRASLGNGTWVDNDSTLHPGVLKVHRLFFRKDSGAGGLSSIQFELEAKGDSIVTFKGQAYGKRLLMCLNTAYDDLQNQSNSSNSQLRVRMHSRYNSHLKAETISKNDFYTKCNSNTQDDQMEQSYIAFQLHNSAMFHVYPYNPKNMGFTRYSVLNNDDQYKYTIKVNGVNKKLRYYKYINNIDIGTDGTEVKTVFFTENSSVSDINDRVLENIHPGTSAIEQSGNPMGKEFLKQYLYTKNHSQESLDYRIFCNQDLADFGFNQGVECNQY
ncbi:MAG TPA: hypothetical protein PKC21_05655 [Oligoflexia bacterium]|nr:hypothetical protein [Oligoflexia bacterium]HMR24820.1 hypothetical protein [Oligoflexia bacterium]